MVLDVLIPKVPEPSNVAVFPEIDAIVPIKSIVAFAPDTEEKGAGSTSTEVALVNFNILPL